MRTLAEAISRHGHHAYLLTAAQDGPHISHVTIELQGNCIGCAMGETAGGNIARVADVSLFWPPTEPGGYASMVNGSAAGKRQATEVTTAEITFTRGQLPTGLVRTDRQPADLPEVVAFWSVVTGGHGEVSSPVSRDACDRVATDLVTDGSSPRRPRSLSDMGKGLETRRPYDCKSPKILASRTDANIMNRAESGRIRNTQNHRISLSHCITPGQARSGWCNLSVGYNVG